MTAPWRPDIDVRAGTSAHRLIRGVLKMDVSLQHVEHVVLYRAPGWTLSLADTGEGDAAPWQALGDTTFHILWQMNEEDAWIEANGDRFPIAPGDTMSVPSGTAVRRAAGMLLVSAAARSATLGAILPPSHGIETFEGYNRRSDYETPTAFTLQRWKITQPLTLLTSDTAATIVDLASPLALTWSGGTDLIARGECRVIEPGTGPVTLFPDGLGYAAVIS